MEEKTPIDNLTEKTFRLLGTLINVDLQDPQWQKEFFDALSEQQQSVQPFIKHEGWTKSQFHRQIYMKPNIELHKPNRKSYTIIIWGVFLMLLIAQIFWLGKEVGELKTTIEKQEKFNEVQSDVISTILDHLLNEIKKDEGSKFI